MGKIKSFITGAAIGAVAALLLAPKNGEQTRALVTEKANAAVSEAKDFGMGVPGSVQDVFKTVQDKATSLVKTAGEAGQDFVNDATSAVKGASSPNAAPVQADDELRQKIEAARQRIAAQVAENAEANKVVEVAADEAQEVAEKTAEA